MAIFGTVNCGYLLTQLKEKPHDLALIYNTDRAKERCDIFRHWFKMFYEKKHNKYKKTLSITAYKRKVLFENNKKYSYSFRQGASLTKHDLPVM